MRTIAIGLGAVLILAGAVWIAQGLDLPLAPRSFMTADRAWILIGAATVLAGCAVIVGARRRG